MLTDAAAVGADSLMHVQIDSHDSIDSTPDSVNSWQPLWKGQDVMLYSVANRLLIRMGVLLALEWPC